MIEISIELIQDHGTDLINLSLHCKADYGVEVIKDIARHHQVRFTIDAKAAPMKSMYKFLEKINSAIDNTDGKGL